MTELWGMLSTNAVRHFAFDAMWQSTLIGLATFVVLRFFRERPAQRAAVTLAAVSLCIVAPLASSAARSCGWGLLTAPAADRDIAETFVAPPPQAAATNHPVPAVTMTLPERAGIAAVSQDALSVVSLSQTGMRLFIAAWLVASAGLALRLARSAVAVRRACRRAILCDDVRLQTALAEAAAKLGVPPPALYTSASVDAPALVTWGEPLLLLPASAAPREDWFAVFCHELAHLVRRDAHSRLAVEIAVMLLPWQPLAWLLRREFRAACEEACDDWAVAAGADPVELASLLVDFIPQARAVPTFVLGMSESVPAARHRILRLLAMQSLPQPRLGRWFGIAGWSVAGVLAVVLALLQYGRSPTGNSSDLPPWGDVPAAVAAANILPPTERAPLMPYRVDPPDVLLIDAVKVVPKPPYHIEPLDTLQIFVLGTLPDQNISGPYSVESDGTVMLGAAYGAIKLAGLTMAEARDAIKRHLEGILVAPEVSVSLAESAGQQQIAGQHLISPDGKVNLGTYGSVYVAGMQLHEVREAVESHLANYLDKPEISIDVYAYNSKFYYIVTERDGGDYIQRVPCIGHERVLDALTQVTNLKLAPNAWVWVARPTPSGASQILPVDWSAIFRGESSATNYWIEPGDRVFVDEKGSPRGSNLRRAATPASAGSARPAIEIPAMRDVRPIDFDSAPDAPSAPEGDDGDRNPAPGPENDEEFPFESPPEEVSPSLDTEAPPTNEALYEAEPIVSEKIDESPPIDES